MGADAQSTQTDHRPGENPGVPARGSSNSVYVASETAFDKFGDTTALDTAVVDVHVAANSNLTPRMFVVGIKLKPVNVTTVDGRFGSAVVVKELTATDEIVNVWQRKQEQWWYGQT